MNELSTVKDLVSGKITRAPHGFWCKENALIALRYAILDYYNYSKEDLYKKFTINDLEKIGLRCIRKFGNMYELLNEAIPEYNLYPWEVKKLPNDFWTEDYVKQAIDWLVFEVLDTTPEKANLTEKVLDNNKLSYLSTFCGSIEKIIQIAYPKEYFNL